MAKPEKPNKPRVPETEIQVAAAAITAAISPPLGIAVAAGSALRSQRVRDALRKGTVNALAGAMQLTDQLSSAAARAGAAQSAGPDGGSQSEPTAREGGSQSEPAARAGGSRGTPSATKHAHNGQAAAPRH
jgi:hypothetical protein